MSTAVVVGGGISGLSACHYLQKSARYSKIIVLEAASRVGGWVHSERHDDGSVFEMGPRSIRPVGSAGFNTLLLAEDLGLQNDIIAVSRKSDAARNRFIYVDKTLHAVPNSLFKASSLLPTPMVWSAIAELFKEKGTADDETIHAFIERRFNSQIADNLIDPLCRGIFAGDCRKLSMRSCFPETFKGEREYGSVILGMAKSPPVKRKLVSKLALRARQERWATYSFKKGIQQLADALEESANQSREVEILKNTPCSSLEWKDGKFLVNVNGESIAADHVFSSVYAKDLAKMLPTEHRQLSSELLKIPAVNAVVVVVELEQKIQLPTPGFGHLLPSFEDGKMLGVIYDSCTFPEHDRTDKPSTRFTIMMGGAWYDDLEASIKSVNAEDLANLALETLFKQLGILNTPRKLQVAVLEECIPQYHLGHYKILENLETYIQGNNLPLSLLGASYKGVSLNDCINNSRLEVETVTGTDLV